MIDDGEVALRCTARLAKLIGRPLQAGADDSGAEFYGNLLWFDSRKCVLITHAETLFSFLVPDVRKRNLADLGQWLVSRVEFELVVEGVPREVLGRLDPTGLRLAKTADRSVLGSMNEFAYYCEAFIDQVGGLAMADIPALNHRLRRIPMSAIGYRYPIEVVAERLGG